MIRYIISFTVLQGRQPAAEKIITAYFERLQKHGPGGMRSQCYVDYDNALQYVQITSFKRESAANHHFRSQPFREYIEQLSAVCDSPPVLQRLERQQTFESIY